MNIIRFRLFIVVCAFAISTSQYLLSSAIPQVSATFAIVPNSIKNTQYNAIITLVNNGPALSHGWQLQFNFSSPDQTIKKITTGIAQTKNNPIIINNIPQHIHTNNGQTRTIRITVNKNQNTNPEIPIINVTADTTHDNNANYSIKVQ